jgi:hypothetical protein
MGPEKEVCLTLEIRRTIARSGVRGARHRPKIARINTRIFSAILGVLLISAYGCESSREPFTGPLIRPQNITQHGTSLTDVSVTPVNGQFNFRGYLSGNVEGASIIGYLSRSPDFAVHSGSGASRYEQYPSQGYKSFSIPFSGFGNHYAQVALVNRYLNEDANGYEADTLFVDSVFAFDFPEPPAVSNLSSSLDSLGNIVLVWSYTPLAGVPQFFTVKRNSIQIGTANENTFPDGNYDGNQDSVTYTIETCNVAGCNSGTSVTVRDVRPHTPSVSALRLSNGTVQVSWAYDGPYVSTFEIYRGGELLGTRSAVFRAYSDYLYDLAIDSHTWGVRACNVRGCSVTGVDTLSGLLVPVPGSLNVVENSAAQLVIGWTHDSPNETGFKIYRAQGTGPKTFLRSAPANSLTFSDASAVPHEEYFYTVTASVGQRETAGSNELRVVRGETNPTPPSVDSVWYIPTPDNVTVHALVDANGLPANAWVEWSSDPALQGSSSSPVVSVGSSGRPVAATFTAAVPRGVYYYRVNAASTAGTTGSPIRQLFNRQPRPVDSATVTLEQDGTVRISWAHAGDHVSYWRVRRRLPTATEPESLADYPDTSLRSATDITYSVRNNQYVYIVRACNIVGCSSGVESVVDGTLLRRPATFYASSNAGGQVTLRWRDVSETETSFEIQRTRSDQPYATSILLPRNATSFSENTQVGITYSYRIRSRNRVGYSTYTPALTLIAQ